ncbi:hypothetical protein BZA77DRAFT_124873 [Pyronema omphalodes]|nr:hypothetical protein BZA77DRAFT_124873 [Pyronema omphalodes]
MLGILFVSLWQCSIPLLCNTINRRGDNLADRNSIKPTLSSHEDSPHLKATDTHIYAYTITHTITHLLLHIHTFPFSHYATFITNEMYGSIDEPVNQICLCGCGGPQKCACAEGCGCGGCTPCDDDQEKK